MTTSTLTLGSGGLRLVVGAVRRTILRHQIIGIDRVGSGAVLAFRHVAADGDAECVMQAKFNTDDGQAIEDWILGGMPDSLVVPAEVAQEVVAPPGPKPGQEIGPGSLVDYLGTVYEVSREAHDTENGVRKWRLNGYLSRGVNESALRLVTPIRRGDKVILDDGTGEPGRTGTVRDWMRNLGSGIGFCVTTDEGGLFVEYTTLDSSILHASRDTDDGVIVVR